MVPKPVTASASASAPVLQRRSGPDMPVFHWLSADGDGLNVQISILMIIDDPSQGITQVSIFGFALAHGFR